MMLYKALRRMDALTHGFHHHPYLYVLHAREDGRGVEPSRVSLPDAFWYNNSSGSPRESLTNLANLCMDGLHTGKPYLSTKGAPTSFTPVGIAFMSMGYRLVPNWVHQDIEPRRERTTYAVDFRDNMYRISRPAIVDAMEGFVHPWDTPTAQKLVVHPALRAILASLTIPMVLGHSADQDAQAEATLPAAS
jgi:hypothetical protein